MSEIVPHLNALAEAMRARVHRDPCGDAVIVGKHGTIHADGAGVSVFLSLNRPSTLARAIDALKAVSSVKQAGDTEAVLFIENSALSASSARLLRRLLKIPKRREVSDATLQRLRTTGFKSRGFITGVRHED